MSPLTLPVRGTCWEVEAEAPGGDSGARAVFAYLEMHLTTGATLAASPSHRGGGREGVDEQAQRDRLARNSLPPGSGRGVWRAEGSERAG